MIDIFSYILGKNKESKETEKYKQIVDDTETALQKKLALDEPISKDDVISTIQGIDVGAIVQGIVKSIGVTLRDVVDTESSISAYKYSNNVDINIVVCVNATSIGIGAIASCISLTSVNMPVATSIGNRAMQNCISLTSVNMPVATSIGDNAMINCVSLTSVNMPSVTNIGDYAMQNCISLTSVNMPVATSIGDNAMRNCISLTSVNMPAATSIGDNAIQNCMSLTSLKLGANQVCTLANSNAFINTPIANGTGYIYVPDELVEDYKVATNWSVYADQIRPMSEYVKEE